MDSFTVEIERAAREILWYAKSIGVTIEVENFDNDHYRVVEQNGNPAPWLRFLIMKSDTKIIEQ